MLEQLMGLQLNTDKKTDTKIKNNLQDSAKDQEIFAMLLSSQLMSKHSIKNFAVDANDTTTIKNIEGNLSDKSQKSLSKELLSTINSKIDTLKNIKNDNDLTALSTKANINLQNIFSEIKTKKEFDGIRSVEDLVKIANKNGLNLQNITIEKMQEAIKNNQDKKVSINDLIQNVSNQELKIKEQLKNNTQTEKISTEELLQNKKEANKERLDTLKKVVEKSIDTEITKLNQIKDNLPQIGEFQANINKKDIINNQDYKQNVVKDFTNQINNSLSTHNQHQTLSSLINQTTSEQNGDISESIDPKSKAIKGAKKLESGMINANDTDVESDKSAKKIVKPVDKKDNTIPHKEDFSLSSLLRDSTEFVSKEDFSLNSLLSQISETKTTKDVEKALKQIDESFSNMLKGDDLSSVNGQFDNKNVDTNNELTAKTVKAKETIKRFVSNLEQKIQDYKPPLMKIDLELRPLNLGTVDVTVIARGNSLSIQLSSNPQALQMFMDNQNDFKNALAQIGFENVKMDFNSNGGGNQQNSGNNQNSSQNRNNGYYSQNENLENKIESIEITIPKYI